MTDRLRRGLRKTLTAGCWLALCSLGLAGAATAGRAPAGSSTTPVRSAVLGQGRAPTVRVLQLNLCDSGIAGCFTGRSIGKAAAVIRAERPDVVTLNEVCRDDMAVLARALSASRRDTTVASAFKAAVDRPTGGPFRCVNDRPYGIGVLAMRGSAVARYRTYGGVYPSQDAADPEERVWVCIDVQASLLTCTTHTASTSSAVALAQCRFFLNSALPTLHSQVGDVPIILGADLNLHSGGSPSPQSCLPRGYQRVDDGALQDVITNQAFAIRSRTVIDMHGTTDHPGLLVALAPATIAIPAAGGRAPRS